ncbi:MAG: ribonuclease Z [Neisseria sp.]|nr:ribonuclease Z [Neisseria sp.]
MELQFLGTGAGSPSISRNVSSTALKNIGKNSEVWLFDCGEATQHQILRTNIRPGRIRRIFITHLHGDHIFGLPGLLSSRAFLGGTDEPLALYAPQGARAFVETALQVSQTRLSYPLEYCEFTQGGTVLETPEFTVSAHPLAHRIPSFAYRIAQAPRPGGLQVERLRQLGIQPGPQFGLLKNGGSITLGDGRVIQGRDYLNPDIPGRIIAIFGDTKACDAELDAAADADILVHEATFAGGEEQAAEKFMHATVADAANLAVRARAKQLYLTHISARYAGEAGRQMLEAQAQTIFPAAKVVKDFDTYPV